MCFRQKQCWQIFFKIDVLKNFAILTVKHLYWSDFFNKVDSDSTSGLQFY